MKINFGDLEKFCFFFLVERETKKSAVLQSTRASL